MLVLFLFSIYWLSENVCLLHMCSFNIQIFMHKQSTINTHKTCVTWPRRPYVYANPYMLSAKWLHVTFKVRHPPVIIPNWFDRSRQAPHFSKILFIMIHIVYSIRNTDIRYDFCACTLSRSVLNFITSFTVNGWFITLAYSNYRRIYDIIYCKCLVMNRSKKTHWRIKEMHATRA